jgi:hypothetical protein
MANKKTQGSLFFPDHPISLWFFTAEFVAISSHFLTASPAHRQHPALPVLRAAPDDITSYLSVTK